ncbi:---NA--- [Paramuricea clavata]|uniref:---NA n=1 Tax=Paramuricea clavata TaxID=317549 RepID=A0A6S7H7J9_PARCT|nr:---NA--- [Paramuricea clavata]
MAQSIKRISLITLAIVELVTLSIAIGAVGYFIDESSNTFGDSRSSRQLIIDVGTYGRHEFLLSAAAIGIFAAILSLVIAIANIQEKTHWAVNMVTVHAFCALLLLVSASLLAKTTRTYESAEVTNMCKNLEKASSHARCYQLTIGVVFGFVSMALFIADTIIYISILMRNVGISFVNMENVTS